MGPKPYFDKGFWSKKNFEELEAMVPTLVLPKKGKRNAIEKPKRRGKEIQAITETTFSNRIKYKYA